MTETVYSTIANGIYFAQAIAFLQEGKKVAITVKGTSMLPFLRDGDKVMLKSVENMNLKRGDIVLARYGPGFILHRIVRKEDDRIVLEGDGNWNQTEEVLRSDICGIAESLLKPTGEKKLTTSRSLSVWKFWLKFRPVRRYIIAVYKLTLVNYRHK